MIEYFWDIIQVDIIQVGRFNIDENAYIHWLFFKSMGTFRLLWLVLSSLFNKIKGWFRKKQKAPTNHHKE